MLCLFCFKLECCALKKGCVAQPRAENQGRGHEGEGDHRPAVYQPAQSTRGPRQSLFMIVKIKIMMMVIIPTTVVKILILMFLLVVIIITTTTITTAIIIITITTTIITVIITITILTITTIIIINYYYLYYHHHHHHHICYPSSSHSPLFKDYLI